jgi:hypothetical protein
MQRQVFDQKKFSDMFNKEKRICMSKGKNAYIVATHNESE